MDRDDRLGGLLAETKSNAILSWVFVLVLTVAVANSLLDGSLRWAFFTTVVVLLILLPPVSFRDPLVMPPWELLFLVAIPPLWNATLGRPFVTDIPLYIAVAAVALLIAVELHRFTPVRMNHTFAIGFVVVTTLAIAGVWNVLQWLSDVYLGTAFLLDGRSQQAINDAVMVEFIYAAIAGIGGGLVFDWYFRTRPRSGSERTAVPPRPLPVDELERTGRQKLRDRLGISKRCQRQASRAMQVLLGGILLVGIARRDLPTASNAAIALAITFVPAILERDYELPMDAGLVLWITAAVFLHAIGTAGLYDVIARWDNLTHALSASVVAAAGYSIVRAIHLHTDDVYIPPRTTFVFILLFVLAAGVVWEILEFFIDQSADRLGIDAVLAQHGINDTIVDLLFNIVGALVVALWGTAYLTDVSRAMSERLDEWFESP